MDKLLIKEYYFGAESKHITEDDLADRLNNRVTVYFLMLCIFVITTNMYVGAPINCWTPAEFKDQHDGYTNSICWLKGSYYLPTGEIIIPDRSKPRTDHVSYYQWTPFILLGMGLFFLVPRLLWHSFLLQGGFNIQRLVKTIYDQKDADKGVDNAKQILKSYLNIRENLNGTPCCGFVRQGSSNSYIFMYFGIKILYVVNTVSQFFLLNLFLSFNFTSFGIEVLNKALTGEDWFESPRFPRVTMCDFMVRRLGSNQHWYSIQCNLPINMYNEKIFLCIWLWLIILTALNLLSILSWMVTLGKARRMANLNRYLLLGRCHLDGKVDFAAATRAVPAKQLEDIGEFTDYLTSDGFLIFELIARNTNEIIAGKLLEDIYKNYHSSR